MKIIIFLAVAFLTVSCLKVGENTYYIKTTGRVEIKQSDIPLTATVNQVAEIKARAGETNGCWSNLNFILTKTGDMEYSLDAFGTYESYGTCPDVLVFGDTTIAFTPTQTGKYVFHVTRSSTEIDADTMTVIGEN